MQVIPGFSYPILIDDFDIKDQLVSNLEDSWDDVQREDDLFVYKGMLPNCGGFYNWVEERANFYMTEVLGYDAELTMNTEVQTSQLGTQVPAHTHPGTYVTGYFMVKYDEQVGHTPLVLENPFRNSLTPSIQLKECKPTMWNTANFVPTVTEGQLILFPSNLVHFFPRMDADDRVVVQFDFVAK